jgi:hypothetical protein
MIVADDAISLLQSSGYQSQSRLDGAVVAEFEDAAIFGFLASYETTADLLNRWKSDHDAYVRSRVQHVRAAAEKRSNMYAVFVSRNSAGREQLREIREIEENFVGSRKIVGTGVTSREQLRSVFLPLLPMQSTARIADADLERRLEKRLDGRPGLFEHLIAASDAENLVTRVLSE